MMDEAESASKPNINLTGSQRAALLLMALGEDEAAQILKHMGPKEVQALGSTMVGLNNITQEQISFVLDDFVENVRNESSLSIGSQDYLKKILNKALGEERAGNVISRISMGTNSKGLDALKWMDPNSIVEVLKDEHPQIIAIVLVYLDSDQASDVLSLLPESIRPEVMVRIAKLDGIHPSALSELDEIFEKRLEGNFDTKLPDVGGVKVAADILNGVKSDIESEILEKLQEVDSEMTTQIQDQMFIFENLLALDDRGAQTLLREVSSDSLVIALKGASPEMQEKIFKNMSKRAAEMLRDDLETKGPVRLAEVEAAQKDILVIARKLSDEGQIMLGSGGDDFV